MCLEPEEFYFYRIGILFVLSNEVWNVKLRGKANVSDSPSPNTIAKSIAACRERPSAQFHLSPVARDTRHETQKDTHTP